MTEQEAKAKWCPMTRKLDWTAESVRAGDELQFAAARNALPSLLDRLQKMREALEEIADHTGMEGSDRMDVLKLALREIRTAARKALEAQ